MKSVPSRAVLVAAALQLKARPESAKNQVYVLDCFNVVTIHRPHTYNMVGLRIDRSGVELTLRNDVNGEVFGDYFNHSEYHKIIAQAEYHRTHGPDEACNLLHDAVEFLKFVRELNK